MDVDGPYLQSLGVMETRVFPLKRVFFFFFGQLPEGEEKYYKKRHKIADSTLQSVVSGVQLKGSLNQHCPAKVYSGFRRFDR